jgi:hypothetical protein
MKYSQLDSEHYMICWQWHDSIYFNSYFSRKYLNILKKKNNKMQTCVRFTIPIC